jgi:hypothetical protein
VNATAISFTYDSAGNLSTASDAARSSPRDASARTARTRRRTAEANGMPISQSGIEMSSARAAASMRASSLANATWARWLRKNQKAQAEF